MSPPNAGTFIAMPRFPYTQTIVHSVLVTIAAAGALKAQSGGNLAALERDQQAAQQAEARWMELAGGLDARLARMLPCDPRAEAAIQEVSQASVLRLTALDQYLDTQAAAATADSEAVLALHAQIQSGQNEYAVQQADTLEELAAVDQMMAMLTASAAAQPTLNTALNKLGEIRALVQQRAAQGDQRYEARPALLNALADLAQVLQDREIALRDEQLAHEAERARWNSYYTTRLNRAQLECSITGQ